MFLWCLWEHLSQCYTFLCKKVGYLTRTLFFPYGSLFSFSIPCSLLQFPSVSFPNYPCLNAIYLLALMQWTVVCLCRCRPILITSDVMCYQLISQFLPYCSLHPLNRAKLARAVWSDFHCSEGSRLLCDISDQGTILEVWLIPNSSLSSPNDVSTEPFPVPFPRQRCIIV